MDELKEVEMKIQELRKRIHDLIEERDDLLNFEIITVSKMLDNFLNEYNKLLSEKAARQLV